MTPYADTVAVVCDGKELETYVPVVDGRTISGWIASEIGKPFTIAVRQVASGRRPHTAQHVYVDGVRVRKKVPRSADGHTHKGFRPTPTTFAPFMFAPLKTTDDPTLSAPGSSSDELGTLSIRINRIVRMGSAPRVAGKARALPDSVVHERDKKHILGGLSVTSGEAVEKAVSKETFTRPYKKNDPVPYVTFIFKYRSRDYLIAQDIIPIERPAVRRDKRGRQSDSGAEVEDAKPAKRICVDELDEDRARLRALKEEMRNIEARVANNLGQPAPNVKREPFPFAVGEVVDLTGLESPPRPSIKRESAAAISLGDAAGTVIDLTDD
ncbi:hypothetical protein AURDEDRAFT_183903 [Auricularia subglabra TFB-10046 SS5]|nr:hypothetical protein AURDEDRAFT_183903 [Auricularia subglabra TFB-10046 SS5]